MRSLLAFRRRSDWLLAVVDLACAGLVGLIAYQLRFEGDLPLGPHFRNLYLIATPVAGVVYVLAGRAAGLYRRGALRGTSNLAASFTAAIFAGIVLLAVGYGGLDGDLSRGWIALVTFGLLLTALGSRGLLRRTRRALVPLGIALERYAVVGDGRAAQRLYGDLTRARGAPYRVAATYPTAMPDDELVRRAVGERLDGVVLAPAAVPRSVGTLASALAAHGIDVLVAPEPGDLDSWVADVALLHGVPLLRMAALNPSRPAIRGRRRTAATRTWNERGVAILGTRGVPASYGGFETFAERLALRLVDRGVPVTVYGRRGHITATSPWRGVRLAVLPTVAAKYLETVVHTALSALHLVATRGPRDVLLCNAANAPVLVLLRLAGRRVILNVDGLEWRRSKWGIAGRAWYRMGEWLAVRLASVLVTDAEEVRTYYRVRHSSESVMIPYGADLLDRGSPPLPAELAGAPVGPGLIPDGYVLYVSRWEPENNPLLVAEAHTRSGCDAPLVMLGRAAYDAGLAARVRATARPDTMLPGAVYGESYRSLQANALCYVHATEVGGTHPALIEAMGAGNVCLVLDTPENREVAGEAAYLFADADDLAALLRKITAMTPAELTGSRGRARRVAAARYSWDAVTESYLRLLRG
jgi:glycosyltransferase involved in cell wall biosynthesis